MSKLKQLGSIEKTLAKDAIVEMAQQDIAQVIESGKFDLLKTYIELKRYDTYLSELIEQIKPHALKLAEAQENKKFEYEKAKINVQYRTSYDFSEDEKWAWMHRSMKNSQKTIKNYEEKLKKLEEPTEIVDEDTGDLYVANPPTKTQNSLLVVSF